MGVRPRHDDEGLVGARVDRRLDAIAHLLGRDELLAGPVAAALRLNLVLQVAAGGAGPGHLAHGAGDHEGPAPPRVGVDEERQVRGAGDPPDVLAHVVQARDPEVGHAVRGVRDAGPGKVDRPEPRPPGQERAVRVDRSRHLEGSLGFYCCAQARAGGSGLGRHEIQGSGRKT